MVQKTTMGKDTTLFVIKSFPKLVSFRSLLFLTPVLVRFKYNLKAINSSNNKSVPKVSIKKYLIFIKNLNTFIK